MRDHCHITGKFRRAAHNQCNLKWQISAERLKIPVFFHNLKGYDSDFVMQNITDEEISVIPYNMEKYLTYQIGEHLVFRDTS